MKAIYSVLGETPTRPDLIQVVVEADNAEAAIGVARLELGEEDGLKLLYPRGVPVGATVTFTAIEVTRLCQLGAQLATDE